MNDESPITRAPWQPTVAVILLALLVAVSAYQAISNHSAPSRFEYKVEIIPDGNFKQSMDAAGFEGWEAVSARRASDGNTANPVYSYEVIFKRPMGRSSSSLIPLKTP